MANLLIFLFDWKSIQSMLIHRTSLIAPVLEDYKRQTLRGADGVDMLLLDSKVYLLKTHVHIVLQFMFIFRLNYSSE